MSALNELIGLLIFPGFLFVMIYATFCEWVDRKAYARFQNRIGPPLYQPVADFVKLMAKEEIVPDGFSKRLAHWLPVVGLSAAVTAFLYMPVWRTAAVFGFYGDLIVVLYLLSLPTLVLFLAGWYSTNAFAGVGAARAVTQLVSYEVPFILAMIAPAILTGSTSISEIAARMRATPWLLAVDLIGFAVAVIALQAKLERVPFDAPEAETEIVAGPLTEYSGRGLALFRLMSDVIMITGAALITSLFLGGLPGGFWGFPLFLLKTLFVVVLLSLIKAVTARLRIEQVVAFCWRFLVPVSILQVILAILVKGWWLK